MNKGVRRRRRSKSHLEVDAVVEAPPDEEALDEAAAGQAVFVQVDPEQTAVGLVLHPLLIVVRGTCRNDGGGDKNKSLEGDRFWVFSPRALMEFPVTWTRFTVDAISDSLVTGHDVML